MTLYVILLQSEGLWEDIGQTEQRSARAAIKQAIEGPTGSAPKQGTFIAVPARSWKPVKAEVETKTSLKFS